MSLSGTYRLVSAIENGAYTYATLNTALASSRTKSEFQAAVNDRYLLSRLMNCDNGPVTIFGASGTGAAETEVFLADPKVLCSVLPQSYEALNFIASYSTLTIKMYAVKGMQEAIYASRQAMSFFSRPDLTTSKHVKQFFSTTRMDDTGPVLAMARINSTGAIVACTATSVMIRRKGEDFFSRCNLPVAFVPSDVFYHPNVDTVVAVGSPAATSIFYSTDGGETWTQATNPTANALNKVTWAGKWVAVGVAGTIISSTDAITWVSRTSGTANALQDVVGDGTQYIAVGVGGAITRSVDGDTWSLRTSGVTGQMNSVVAGPTGHFIAVGVAATSVNATRSTDGGLTWTAQAIISTTTSFNNVAYSTGKSAYYVGASTTGAVNLAAYSTNGTTWTNISFGSNSGSRVAALASTVLIVPTATTLGFALNTNDSLSVRPTTNVDGTLIATNGQRGFLLAEDGAYVNTNSSTLVCNNLPKI